MEILWLGHSCFRLRGREATVLTDPCPPSTGYNIGRVNADIVTISHSHDDHSYIRALTGEPVLIQGPGEYEVHGAFITGIGTYHTPKTNGERQDNVSFVVELEDMRICHLGDLGRAPTAAQVEELSGVDVLLVPIGGGTTIDGKSAAEVVNLLEPKLVIPMHYRTDVSTGELESPERFLKEMGAQPMEPQPKLTVTRSSLPHEPQVMLLDFKR